MGNAQAIFTNVFRDFDAFAEAIEDADMRITMPRLNTPLWQVTGLYLPGGMHAQIVRERSGNIAQGSSPGHGCNIYVLQEGHVVANGVEIPPGSAFVIPARSEFLVTSLGSTRWFSVFIPTPLLDSFRLESDCAERSGVRDARVINGRSGRSSQLWPLIDRFVHHALRMREEAAGAESLANFQRELLAELNRVYGRPLPATQPARGRPGIVDRAAIARAVDYIESCRATGTSIAELVQTTGLPERSLRAGFQKYLGVSPTRYMQVRLLHVARQRLTESARGETTVTQVAGELGLWDFGRFARRYREIFGELPSTTLRNRGRANTGV